MLLSHIWVIDHTFIANKEQPFCLEGRACVKAHILSVFNDTVAGLSLINFCIFF